MVKAKEGKESLTLTSWFWSGWVSLIDSANSIILHFGLYCTVLYSWRIPPLLLFSSPLLYIGLFFFFSPPSCLALSVFSLSEYLPMHSVNEAAQYCSLPVCSSSFNKQILVNLFSDNPVQNQPGPVSSEANYCLCRLYQWGTTSQA